MNVRLRQLLSLLICLAALLANVGSAAAQAPDDSLKVQRGVADNQPPQVQGGGVVQQQSRPFYLQGAVVAILCGGAVWTVCRSSRRQ